LLRRLTRVYHSRELIINRTDMTGPPAADRVGAVVFRVASPHDDLGEFERYGRGALQHRYVENDRDWLFVACYGSRIVATVRYGRTIRDPVVSRLITLGPRQVWASDVFCLPEYREQGITIKLLHFVWRTLVSRGFTEVLGTIVISNTTSLRIFARAGSQPLCYVKVATFLGWQRVHISPDIPGNVPRPE
jgi:GNAT superfamily N-acetyltransferase